METNFTYIPKYDGRGAYPRFGTIAVYDRSGNVLYETSGLAGILTGYASESPNTIPWLQLTAVDGVHIFGYVKEDTVELRLVEEIAPYNAQVVVDTLIDNDKKILSNLLVSAEIVRKLAAAGKDTTDYESKIRSLYIDLYNRNQLMYENKYIMEDVQTGESGLTAYGAPLAAIVNGQSLGVVLTATTVLIIVVSAVVAGGLATAAYYAYNSAAYQSGKGLKESAELRTLLESVSPEIAESIRNDLNGQLSDAYSAGLSKNMLSTVKFVGIAVGAVLLYRWILPRL